MESPECTTQAMENKNGQILKILTEGKIFSFKDLQSLLYP